MTSSNAPKVYTNVQSIDLFDHDDGSPGFSVTLTQTKVFSTEEERDEALKSHSQTPDAHAEIARLKEENERLEKKNKKLDEGCRAVAQVLADTAEEKAKILQDAADIGGEIREAIEAIPDHLRSNWCNKASDLSEKLGWLGTPFNETSEF